MKKPRAVNYELIAESADGQTTEPYLLLEEVRNQFHRYISSARVALAWRIALKPDVDGHLVLGRCVKVSDLQKEFADYDFIILLNREVWNDEEFTRKKKIALLDHEMCHASITYDEDTGEAKHDARGRLCYRLRKHDIEEFQSVVEHHGTYKRDLEKFARAILLKQGAPLFKEETTVSIGMKDASGKMQYSEPFSTDRFTDITDKIRGRKTI